MKRQMVNTDHKAFKDLVEYMFKLDPKKRPSAKDCLKHHFFQIKITDETCTEQAQELNMDNIDLRNQSKSTEKTNGSLSTLSQCNER